MDKNQDNIERYLDGELHPEELKAFEAALEENSLLKEALEEAQTARKLIAAAGRLELKETLEGFEEEIASSSIPDSTEVKVVPLWVKRVIPIAAMIVVFVGAYWFMLGNNKTSSEIFNKYFEAYESPSVLRDSQTDTPLHWNTAVRYYQERKYEEALRNFSKAEPEIPKYLVDFYTGISTMSLETPDYTVAIDYFLQVERGDNDFGQQARWYRGLALLGNGETDKARAVFQEIVDTKSYNFKEAQKIIRLDWED